jgi:hypothetical protein
MSKLLQEGGGRRRSATAKKETLPSQGLVAQAYENTRKQSIPNNFTHVGKGIEVGWKRE